ncbi:MULTISPECIES: AMIN domain-containing protein [unclassified Nitratiruptor]|uniref:AMIN domain-containing protein n=1 Tax=unclassified Nitratiruptor TaxID=2624044 RepID=UPI001914F71E|nr:MULTISPECIES: AMIN domain-containing protein [unclassified Nitratiruptor]
MRIIFFHIATITFLLARINPFYFPGEVPNLQHSSAHIKQSISSQADEENLSTSAHSISANASSVTKDNNTSSISSHTLQTSAHAAVSQSSQQNRPSLETPFTTLQLGFATIGFYKDKIGIHTQDRLKKEFLLDSPPKIVIDFAAKRRFQSKKQQLKTPLFKDIAIGAHKNFYRIAISLDGECRNRIKKEADTIWIYCH